MTRYLRQRIRPAYAMAGLALSGIGVACHVDSSESDFSILGIPEGLSLDARTMFAHSWNLGGV